MNVAAKQQHLPHGLRLDDGAVIVDIYEMTCTAARRSEAGLARRDFRCVIEFRRPRGRAGVVHLYAQRAVS